MLRSVRALFAVPLLLLALPASADASWTPVAPGGGWVWKVVLDPASPTTLYAAAGTAGVYASDDAGASWNWRADGLEGLEVKEIAIDSSRDPHRLYVVTWVPRRVYASDDGGVGWHQVFEAFDFAEPGLTVGGEGTVYLHTWWLHVGHERGSRWVAAPLGDPDPIDPVHQVVAHPTVPGRVVARTELSLWQSEDAGESWVRLSAPEGPQAFAFAPTEPEVAYLSAGQPFALQTYRSADRGGRWEHRGDLAWEEPLVVDPFDAAVLYGGSGTLSRISRDAGVTWDVFSHPFTILDVVADPSVPGRLLGASEAHGVLASDDGGVSWRRDEQLGLTANRFAYLSFDRLGRLYASWDAWSGGNDLRRDGSDWSELPSRPPIGFLRTVVAEPSRPWVIYAGSHVGLAVSRDDGSTWRVLAPQTLRVVNGLHVPSRGPLVAAGHGIHWSDDDGESWQESFPTTVVIDANEWEVEVVDLVSDPQRQNVLYAAVAYRFTTRPSSLPPEPVIFRSLDGGKSWRRFVAGSAVLALAPSLPRTLYVAFGEVVLTSDDGGLRWRVAGVAGGEVRDLEVDPRDPRTVFAATAGAGVQWSRDGGASWEPLASGLAEQGRLEVDRVRIDPLDPDRLYALPRRGGLFELRK